MAENTYSPAIQWDFGTAYELFISLHVLHEPDYFGIRASWAAGVRSRIPAAERKLLEDVYPLSGVPIAWLYSLPAPKDAITALWTIKQIPAAERLIKLQQVDQPCNDDGTEDTEKHKRVNDILLRIASSRAWKPEDVDFFMRIWGKKKGRP